MTNNFVIHQFLGHFQMFRSFYFSKFKVVEFRFRIVCTNPEYIYGMELSGNSMGFLNVSRITIYNFSLLIGIVDFKQY